MCTAVSFYVRRHATSRRHSKGRYRLPSRRRTLIRMNLSLSLCRCPHLVGVRSTGYDDGGGALALAACALLPFRCGDVTATPYAAVLHYTSLW